MGVVYKAEDTKLDRIVALKFLPQHITTNESDKARFLQEAKAASAINHPNVCIIHDIQEHNGQQFIVMEYVEGITLKEEAQNKKLKTDRIFDYTAQIAAALSAAHEKDIVHRDIKSENIMITKTGQIKVMDFGLARLRGSGHLTKTTSIAGTLAYMSPEHIQGHEVDTRSDIFSFGVILYEMLTGQLPFKGEYESAMMYSILNEEPEPVQKFIPNISSELLHILNRALEKEPNNRYQNMKDVLIDLKRLKRDSIKTSDPEMSANNVATHKGIHPKSKRKWIVPISIIISILVVAFFVLKYVVNFSKLETAGEMRIIPFTNLSGQEWAPAFSPDGKQIAFYCCETDTSKADIYVQLVGTTEAVQLTKSPEQEWFPAWTPDGRQLVFARNSDDDNRRGMHLMSALGGGERRISSKFGRNLCFSPTGEYLAFSNGSDKSIYLLSMKDYQTQKLTSPIHSNWNGDDYPAFSPNNKILAFVRAASYYSQNIFTMSFPEGEPKQLTFENYIIEGIAWTPDGKSIIFSSNRGGPQRLWQVNVKSGKISPLYASGQNSLQPTISMDGRLLAYSERFSRISSLWRMKIPNESGQKIRSFQVPSTLHVGNISLSPDGKRIAFGSYRSGYHEVWSCDINLDNCIQLTDFKSHASAPHWSPKGDSIVFDARLKANANIFAVSSSGGAPKALTQGDADDSAPFWSLDGKWIYFTSNRSGEDQIWRIPSGGGDAVQITMNGALTAKASADGNWVYYCKPDSGLYRIPAQGGKESMILELDKGYLQDQWAVSDDGIYFLKKEANDIRLKFYDIGSSKIKNIGICDQKRFTANIRLSPDHQWIYFIQLEPTFSDIYLVENFR